MRAWRSIAVLGVLAGALIGCEGTTTGTEVVNVALQPAEQPTARGSYAPVKLNLSTDMNPVAINFRADFSLDATEFGKWNTYRVALTQGGNTVASRNMNVNHPQSNAQGDAPPPTGTVHTLFITDLQSSGEFELTITPVKPVVVTLKDARVDVRRNVARPPT
jgi:hypothetical protein